MSFVSGADKPSAAHVADPSSCRTTKEEEPKGAHGRGSNNNIQRLVTGTSHPLRQTGICPAKKEKKPEERKKGDQKNKQKKAKKGKKRRKE